MWAMRFLFARRWAFKMAHLDPTIRNISHSVSLTWAGGDFAERIQLAEIPCTADRGDRILDIRRDYGASEFFR